jgi:TolA-binding protein
MRSPLRVLVRRLVPALALAASACWVPLEQGELIDSRLEKLEAGSDAQARRLDELQRRIDDQDRVVKDRVATVDRKIVEAQQKIDELNQAARRSGADLGVSVSKLQDEVARAKGDLEVQQHKLGQLEAQLADMQQASEKRFAALKGRGALDEAEAKQLLESLPRQDDKAGLMALARGQEQKGNAGVARQLYDEYLRRFPTDPGAAEAAVRSGDLSAGQGRWKEAFIGYGWVYKNQPQSERAPDAMFGMATSMLELDELRPDAPAMLNEIVLKYPKSAAAAKAKAKLAELAPPPPPPPPPAKKPVKKPARPAGGK